MSMNASNSKQFEICDRCQRRYHVDVYQRHIRENQCLKRNSHRLPFQSIKQRTIRIGDQIYSIPQQEQKTIQSINNKNKNQTEKFEQGKQLLKSRIQYKPPKLSILNKISSKVTESSQQNSNC